MVAPGISEKLYMWTMISIIYTHICNKDLLMVYQLDFSKRNASEIFKSMYSFVLEWIKFWFCITYQSNQSFNPPSAGAYPGI